MMSKKYDYAYLIPAIAWYKVENGTARGNSRSSTFNHLEMTDYRGQTTPTVKVPGSLQEQWKNYKWVAESGYMEGSKFMPLQLYEGDESTC